MDKEKRKVPKFSSFQPKKHKEEEEEKEHAYEYEKKEKVKKKKKEKKEKEKESRREEERGRYKESSSKKSRYDDQYYDYQRREPDLPSKLLNDLGIKFDTRGDKDALMYGNSYKYDIPNYRRSGGGRILGLPDNYRIDHVKSKKKGSIYVTKYKKDNGKVKRYMDFDFSESKILFNINQLKKHVGPETVFQTEYIPFIEEEVIEKVEGYNPNQEKIKEYEVRIAQSPNDIQLWLEYCKFYEFSNLKKDFKNKSTILDIQLSMLERALSYNPGNETLLLKFMEYGQQIWDSTTIFSKWENLINKNIEQYSLIYHYLFFRLTNSNQFNVSEIVNLFHTKMNNLLKLRDSFNYNEIERVIFKCFILLTNMLFQSGYNELAISLFQCLIEFNLYQPHPSLFNSFNSKVQDFKIFWEKEWPRFGEEGSTGWSTYSQKKVTPNYGQESKDDTILLPVRSTSSNWLDLNDPFKVVLFEDIQNFIFEFQNRNIIFDVIDHFISVLICPFYSLNNTNQFKFNLDSISSNHFFQNQRILDRLIIKKSQPIINIDFEGYGQQDEPINKQDLEIPIDFIPFCFDTLIHADKDSFNLNLNDLEYLQFSKRVLLKAFELEKRNLMPILLYFKIEELFGNDKVRSVYKSQLKANGNELMLWLAYTDYVWRQGDIDQARNLFINILNMYWEQPNQYKGTIIMVYSHWVKLELISDNINYGLAIINSYSQNGIPKLSSDGALLEVSNDINIDNILNLIQNKENDIMNSNYKDSIQYRYYLIGILTYVKGGIDSYLQFIVTNIEASQNLIKDESILESIIMKHLNSIELIIEQQKVYPVKKYRKIIQNTIELYPNNSYFNTIYFILESKFKLNNFVINYYLNPIMFPQFNLIRCFYAVFSAANYCKDLNRSINALELILNIKKNRSVPIFWILLIKLQELNNKTSLKNWLFSALSSSFFCQRLVQFIVELDIDEQDKTTFLNLASELELRYFLLN